MKIHGLEKLSLVDYDGYVASTVFSGNCNFRCPFCHNALLVTDYDTLPTFDEEEIFSYLKKRKGVIEGVCVSGGEPTLNADLPDFIEKIKNIGLKVKLDTNGTNPKMIKTLFENGLVDYFAMDIKNDLENYAPIIGLKQFDTKAVKESIDFFLTGNADYEFRTTLINEFHKEENIINISKDIKGANKYIMQKFKSGDNCLAPQGLTEVPLETAKKFADIMAKTVKNVKLRGYDL
ncbi:MAG: anaerobic ribonucleoside-triphosphate reductase activating protein [Clostridia bacterium]|nr:anaerobic ribonucleoside-triphosphate reductase activating protein [Clostridia bacterium]